MPHWLKPEINTIIYWIHLAILSFVVLGLLQLFTNGNMLNWANWLWSIPLLGVGDLVAHTLTRMD